MFVQEEIGKMSSVQNLCFLGPEKGDSGRDPSLGPKTYQNIIFLVRNRKELRRAWFFEVPVGPWVGSPKPSETHVFHLEALRI